MSSARPGTYRDPGCVAL